MTLHPAGCLFGCFVPGSSCLYISAKAQLVQISANRIHATRNRHFCKTGDLFSEARSGSGDGFRWSVIITNVTDWCWVCTNPSCSTFKTALASAGSKPLPPAWQVASVKSPSVVPPPELHCRVHPLTYRHRRPLAWNDEFIKCPCSPQWNKSSQYIWGQILWQCQPFLHPLSLALGWPQGSSNNGVSMEVGESTV